MASERAVPEIGPRQPPTSSAPRWRALWAVARGAFTLAFLLLATACIVASVRAHPDPEWIGLAGVGGLALLFAPVAAMGANI